MQATFRSFEISDPSFESEGLRHITVKSPALRRRADITLWLPESPSGPLPLVILLHGVYGSHWAWALKGGAHRIAARLINSGEMPPMALAMPSDGLWGDGSCYVRHDSGEDYERWIMDEVPAAAALACSALTDAPFFISGLSMGGYGALRLAARHGSRILAASAHSAASSLDDMDTFSDEGMVSLKVPPGEQSLIECLSTHCSSLPPFRFDCGLDDVLLPQNRRLHEDLVRKAIPHTYEELSGDHSWPYWSENLARSLAFFAKNLPNSPTKATQSRPF